MHTTDHLHRVRPNVFQVVINGVVAAVLRQLPRVTGTEVWVLADEPRLLTTVTDPDVSRVAERLRNGSFDNDFRFEITENPEPDDPASMYFVRQIATPSQQVLEAFTTDRPYDAVEAAREAQVFSLEERWAMDAEREAAERR